MVEKLSITLPSDMVDVIKARVQSGDYASTSEVLRDAMRTWMRQEEEHEGRMAAIRARIQAAMSDERPLVRADEAFMRIRAEVTKALTKA